MALSNFKSEENKMKTLSIIIFVLFVTVVSYSQKVDLEKSEVVNTSPESGGKIFRVKVTLKKVDDSIQESGTVKKLTDISVLKCVIMDKNISVNAISADDTRLIYNCDFDRKTVIGFGTFRMKLTFTGATVENQDLFATPQANTLNIKTVIADPIWFSGDNFVTIPITVDKSIFALVNFDCSTPGRSSSGSEKTFLIKGSIPNNVQIKMNTAFASEMTCATKITEGDESLKDVADISFTGDDGKILNPKEWTSLPRDAYQISVSDSEDLKTGIVLINSFKAKDLRITTIGRGSMKMFIDNNSVEEDNSDTISSNQTLTISEATILRIKNEPQIQHTVRFEGVENGNRQKLRTKTFPLIININPRIISNKIGLEKIGNSNTVSLVIDYEMENPVDTALTFVDSNGTEIGLSNINVTCSKEGKCKYTFNDLMTDFVSRVANRLSGQKTSLFIKIISVGDRKLIGSIGFDAIKPFDNDKVTAFNEFANTVKSPKDLTTENVQEFVRIFSQRILGLNQSTDNSEEENAIKSLIYQIRTDKKEKNTDNQNKILTILKFAGRIGLAYFGLPAPF